MVQGSLMVVGGQSEQNNDISEELAIISRVKTSILRVTIEFSSGASTQNELLIS